MSLYDELQNDHNWDEFLDYAIEDENISETMYIQAFIRERRYHSIVTDIIHGTHIFADPFRLEIKKSDGSYRVVYTLKNRKEMSDHIVLRMMGWLTTRKYNYVFSPNIYTCAENDGVRGAMNNLRNISDLSKKYYYKVDVTNFGNSIDADILFKDLDAIIEKDDVDFFSYYKKILKNPHVYSIKKENNIPHSEYTIDMNKGAMTGMPFCSFFSNVYLMDLDSHFYNSGIDFFRFNDDMIVLANTEEELKEHMKYIKNFITAKKLEINPNKEYIYRPGDEFVFLGILIRDGKTMISEHTIISQKKKIKKIANRFRISCERKEITRNEALIKTIIAINNYFYGTDRNRYCFTNMYFPLISSSDNLELIDNYAQECIRYVYSGKFSLSNKKYVPYSKIKEWGYIPLKSAYRIYRSQ